MEIAEGRAFPEPDPHVIDIVKLSEARVQTVEQHCHDLEVANADLEAQVSMKRILVRSMLHWPKVLRIIFGIL